MISRLFEESLVIRFLKQLLIYAQHSYLFHFDFKLGISERKALEVKPLGFFESLLVLASKGFDQVAKSVAATLEGSFLFRVKSGFLKSFQEDAVSSVLYFSSGFLMLFGLKAMSPVMLGISIFLGLFAFFGYPLIRKYAEGSILMNALKVFFTGGDAK